MQTYTRGARRAVSQLGLIKVATALALPAAGAEPKPPPGPFWAGVGQDIKSQLIGDPAKYFSEIRDGTWHRPGSFFRSRAFHIPEVPAGASVWRKGLAYMGPVMSLAPTAFSLYGAHQAPREHRGQAYGQAIGSALGHIAGAPLGVLGTMGFSALGSQLGGSIGKLFNARPERSAYHRARDPRYPEYAPPTGR